MKKIRKITSLIVVFCLMFSLTGCGNSKKSGDVDSNKVESKNLVETVSVEEAEGKEIDDKFIDAALEFSVNFYKEVSKGVDKNIMVSPISVIYALGMTTNGASNNTKEQMENVICPGLSIDEYNKYLKTLADDYAEANGDDLSINIANSIWFKENNIGVDEEFLKIVKQYYDAAVYSEKFDQETLNNINAWIEEKTNGMIKEGLDYISPDAVMYLINAVVFEGKWKEAYEEYQVDEQGKFTNSNSVEETVAMLHSTESLYCESGDAKAVIKEYKGGRFAFVGILPNEDIDVNDYVANLTSDKYRELMDSCTREYDVNTVIPEFTIDYSTELSEVMKSLGMVDAFDSDKADLSGLGEAAGELYINRIIHKTHIELDRTGTKAAAVTIVEINSESAAEPAEVKEVILDRPFAFAIIDTETNIPLFIGTVNSINQ